MIPGWEQASWRQLDGGLTNQSWLVEVNEVRGVLKIDETVRGAPFNQRHDEARIQRAAAESGIANRVLYVSDRFYLTEFVDGRIWCSEDFEDDDNLRRLVRAIRELHALPSTGRLFDPVTAAERYLSNIVNADPERTTRCIERIRSMPTPASVCCCHNDLVAENILSVDGLRFLDWEYAADNDPLFDLATIVAHHRLSERQTELLLETYFDGDGERWRAGLAEQARLYEALSWLWKHSRP